MKDSYGKTEQDNLMMPSGKTVGETANLSGEAIAAGVPDVTPADGRSAAAEKIAKHRAAIRKAGADASEAAWLEQHKESAR